MALLVSKSYTEDRTGSVQETIPDILSALLACLIEVSFVRLVWACGLPPRFPPPSSFSSALAATIAGVPVSGRQRRQSSLRFVPFSNRSQLVI